MATHKKPAARPKPAESEDYEFDLEHEHSVQENKNKNLRLKEFAVDLKASYEASLPHAETDEQKAHLESVLASHHFVRD